MHYLHGRLGGRVLLAWHRFSSRLMRMFDEVDTERIASDIAEVIASPLVTGTCATR